MPPRPCARPAARPRLPLTSGARRGAVPLSAARRGDRNPANAGVIYVKPQLFTDTFHLPERGTKKKKYTPDSRANDTRKRTPPKAPAPKKVPLTSEERKQRQKVQWKEKYVRAKALGLCRHCGEPAIPGQTRCENCAEKHRVSLRAYDRKRSAAANQTTEDTQAGPTASDPTSKAAPRTDTRSNETRTKPANGTTMSAERREYERVRSQHPERKEYQRLHEQKKRERAKELGPCRNCSKPAIPGQSRCETCAENHRQSRRRSDAKRRAAVKETATMN